MRSLAVYILLFFSIAAHAQILFGIKGGLNLSTVSVDTRNIANSRSELLPGLNIGVVADFGITHYLSVKTELLFSQKGYMERRYRSASMLSQGNTLYSDTWSSTNNYLELPVLASYFYEGKKFKIFLNAGVYGAYWFGGTNFASFYTNDLGGTTLGRKDASSTRVFDNEYGSNKKIDTRFDVGILSGAGFGIKLKKGWLNFEGRYSQGLIDLNTFQGEIPKTYSSQYNSNWSISVGYVMILKLAKVRVIPEKTEKPKKERAPKKVKIKKKKEEPKEEGDEEEEEKDEEKKDN
jgi:hypothetical protein